MRSVCRNFFGWLIKPTCCAFVVCCFVFVLMQTSVLNPQSASDDEAALRALVERFYAAYTKEDIDSLMALWSTKSPPHVLFKQKTQELFTLADFTFANFTISRVKVEGDKASLRVAVDRSMIFGQTKRTSRVVHNFVFVKEEEVWKVLQYVPAAHELAIKLAAAKTEEARKGLLEEEKELVTAELVQAILARGRFIYKQFNYSQVLTIYRLAQSIAEQIDDKSGLADAFTHIGEVYDSQGDYAQALEHYQRSLMLYDALEDTAAIADTLNSIGNVHRSQGDYAQALDCYRKSLTLSKELTSNAGIAQALAGIGNVHHSQGDYTQALRCYQESWTLFEGLRDKAGIAAMLNNIGNVRHSQGNYGLALEFFQKSLTLSEELKDKVGIAQAFHNIGNVHLSQGNNESALEFYQKSLRLWEEVGGKSGIADALGNIGLVHKLQGNYDMALEFFQKSLTLSEAMGSKGGIANALGNIGLVYLSQGDYTLALESYQKSLALKETMGDKPGTARTQNHIGFAHYWQGNYRKAMEFYQKSLTLSEAIKNKASIANVLNNIGLVYWSQGDYTQAMEFFQKSLTLSKTMGDKAGIARTLTSIGIVHWSQGEYRRAQGEFDKALECYQKSLKQFEELKDKEGVAATLNNIAGVHWSQGRYGKALEFYQRSLAVEEELGDKAGAAAILNNIGEVHREQRNYNVALEFYQKGLTYAEAIGAPDIARHCHGNIGSVYKAQRRTAEAIAAYQKAIACIEAVRSQLAGGKEEGLRFFEDKIDPYHAMVELLIAQNNWAEAFTYAERSKARVLVDIVKSGKVNIAKAMTRDEREKEQKRVQRADFAPLTAAQAAQWFRAQKAQDLLVLEYVVGDDRTWLFALNGMGKLKVYSVKMTHKELEKRVKALRDAMSEKGKPDLRLALRPKINEAINTALRKLDGLLAPAAPLLAKVRQVCIVPDDALWEVPFSALKMPGGKYLVETHAVFYAPSLTALKVEMEAASKRRQSPPHQLLAMAPFAYADAGQRNRFREIPLLGTFKPLPASQKEVAAVSTLFGAKPYLRETATETRFKAEAGKAHILHFATHGVFDSKQGMYSGVVLAAEKGKTREDGYLEAREIVNLNLNADLAVLSACETARGQLSRGEGVIGLSWAFSVGGCPSTVVSQWKVKDESTAQLMKEFYQNLKAGKDKVEALRQAQLSLLRSRRYWHPFYWSPFILVGNWQ